MGRGGTGNKLTENLGHHYLNRDRSVTWGKRGLESIDEDVG